jgi:hypothetical protein
VAANYSPYFIGLLNPALIFNTSTYWKIDSINVLTASFNYFSSGKLNFTDTSGTVHESTPFEYSLHFGYSRKLSKSFSLGANFGLVHSDLDAGNILVNNEPIKPANAFMGDISLFYGHHTRKKSFFTGYNLGFGISNIGGKIYYTESSSADFLPANLGIGSNFNFQFNTHHQFSLALDLNKLLVPTPDTSYNYYFESVLDGIFNSFTDAPDGFSEELAEITISTGIEYWYKEIFALRTGYFYENENKGARQYVTLGTGARYSFAQLDFSYSLATGEMDSSFNIWRLGFTAEF